MQNNHFVQNYKWVADMSDEVTGDVITSRICADIWMSNSWSDNQYNWVAEVLE